MKRILISKSKFSHPIKYFFRMIVCLALTCIFPFLSSCQKETDYFSYVSELRGNIFLAECDGFSLRVYASTREQPYSADGVPRESSARTEIYLLAPSGDKTCELTFEADGKTQGGEMSFDNVKAEYYYYCPLDVSAASQIVCKIVYGEESFELTAISVKTEATLSPQAALEAVRQSENELFSSMTDKYGFSGEIRLRLIYEDSPYYYIGVIDRNGNTTAFLLNAETGKILAKRQS